MLPDRSVGPCSGHSRSSATSLRSLTVRSTWPLLCGNLGLLVACRNPYDSANVANSREAYWGPLSLRRTSGIPYREKINFRAVMTAAEVVVVILMTSGYREK